ncbi:MAG TPA: YggS family pyridoxal phosphate-dependent enzyme [Streptosporangiaceae bacterium]|nr:YggS family pyridoxal phosphate-dependent enzyme [Streptosporangiaceae bacterium]
MSDERRSYLAGRLELVWARIEAACAAAGRARDEITLIAVTKTWPASDVRLLYGLGQRDFGENRDQEAAPKAAACADLDLRWHFVGQLQTNKVSNVTRYADVVHSVDRLRLVRALGQAARRRSRPLTALIQVSLEGPDGDPGRGGAAPGEVTALAEAVVAEADSTSSRLVLGGVMAVAPLGAPATRAFAGLGAAVAAVRAVQPAATMISAGMSGDLEAAVEAGATHLRIGTALLGDRSVPVM